MASRTLYQTFASRRHNRLSCVPRLVSEIKRELSDGAYLITYTVFNKGLGPAEVTNIQLHLDGEPCPEVEHPCRVLCERVFSKYEEFIKVNYDAWFNSGYLIAEKESYKFVQLKFKGGESIPKAAIENDLKRLRLELKYSSLYGEKNSFDSDKN